MKKLLSLIVILCAMLMCAGVEAEGKVSRNNSSIITYDEYLERMTDYTNYADIVNQKIAEIKSEGPLYYGSYEEFAQEINELSAQKLTIQRKLSALSGDDSLSARAKKAKLNAELAEAEAAMEALYAARSRSSSIDALNREVQALYESLFGSCSGSYYTHDMRRWITASDREQHYTCLLCGYYVVLYVDDINHTEVIDEAKAATCTETGLTEGTHCAVCGEVLTAQQIIPAKGHNEVVDAAKPATCTASGLTEGTHCSTCDEILQNPTEISPLGHEEMWIPGVASSCTADGLTDGCYCSRCNEVLFTQEVIPATGHRESAGAEDERATCTSSGLTTEILCDWCDEVLVEQTVIPALGHDEVRSPGYAATCTTDGLTSGSYCTRCDKVLSTQEVIPALGHDEWHDDSIPPTCTEDGYYSGISCLVCGEILRERKYSPALGHDYDEGIITKDPACTSEGIITYTCKNDSTHKEYKEIEALGHEEVTKEGFAATCTTDGLSDSSYCSRCGKELSTSITIPSTGHVEVPTPAVDRGETTPGYTGGKHCSVCGEVTVDPEVIPAIFQIIDGILVSYNGSDTVINIPANVGITELGDSVFSKQASSSCVDQCKPCTFPCFAAP